MGLEDKIIARFQLSQFYRARDLSDARKLLEKHVDIDSGAKDGLILISVVDTDPNRAAEIANGYVEEFRQFSASLALTEASQRRLFFEQRLEKGKNNLANAEEELKKTQQDTGLLQVDSQARAAVESVAQLRGEIAAKEVHSALCTHTPQTRTLTSRLLSSS